MLAGLSQQALSLFHSCGSRMTPSFLLGVPQSQAAHSLDSLHFNLWTFPHGLWLKGEKEPSLPGSGGLPSPPTLASVVGARQGEQILAGARGLWCLYRTSVKGTPSPSPFAF